MNFKQKLGVLGVGIGLSMISWFPALMIVEGRSRKLIRPYVEKNLAGIVKAQEEKLGIKHFGLPGIKYESQLLFNGSLTLGGYSPKDDTIYLNTIFSITPELNATNLLMKFLSFGLVFDIKKIMDHELGHFYVDKKYENLGIKNWHNLPYNIALEEFISIKIIAEGISEYFEKEMNHPALKGEVSR